MADFYIRFAGPGDATAIADISHSTFVDTFGEHNTQENMDLFMKEQFSRDKLIKEVSADKNIFLVACEGEEIIAYVRLREDDDNDIPSMEIARIYAAKQSKGRGVGKALMQKCIEVAIQKNRDVIWLGVWEHNHHAIEFYKKAGFEKYGEHIFMLGNDPQTDWLMKKHLK